MKRLDAWQSAWSAAIVFGWLAYDLEAVTRTSAAVCAGIFVLLGVADFVAEAAK